MWTGVSRPTCGLIPDWMYPNAIYISLGFYYRVGQYKRVSQQQVVVGRRWRVVAKGVVKWVPDCPLRCFWTLSSVSLAKARYRFIWQRPQLWWRSTRQHATLILKSYHCLFATIKPSWIRVKFKGNGVAWLDFHLIFKQVGKIKTPVAYLRRCIQ